MDILEEFLMNSTVVKIDSCAELVQFCYLMRELGLKKIQSFWKAIKGGTDVGWIPNNYPWEELCVEYQLGKGFTISGKTENLNYGNNIVSFFDFKKALDFNLVEKNNLPIYDEVDKLPDKGFAVRIFKKAMTDNASDEGYIIRISKTQYGAWVMAVKDVKYAKIYTSKKILLRDLEKAYSNGSLDYYDYEYHIEDVN